MTWWVTLRPYCPLEYHPETRTPASLSRRSRKPIFIRWLALLDSFRLLLSLLLNLAHGQR